MNDRNEQPLRARLRAGDPAAGDLGLAPAERARLRAAILDAAAGRPRTTPWLAPAAAAATALILMLGLSWMLRPRAGPPPSSAPSAGAPGFEDPALPSGSAEDRQIQFTTPGGTLVVWVLTSDPPSRP